MADVTMSTTTTTTATEGGAGAGANAGAAQQQQQKPAGATSSTSTSSYHAPIAVPGYSSFLVNGTRFDVQTKYRLNKHIGQGSFGVVCSAINTETNRKVAIKKITRAFNHLIETKRTLREVRLLRHFKHENIIELVDIMKPVSFEQFDDIYLITEEMHTDLHQVIASRQPLSDEHVQFFIYQILRGLKYLHSGHVIHRDLKPSNLLVNANCDLRICDFGLSRVVTPNSPDDHGFLTEYVATRWYRAPEIMLSWREYTKAIDVWSVGCIMAEILGHKPLFPGRDYIDQLHSIINTLGTPSPEDTAYIASERARAYIRDLPPRPRVSFAALFPNASASCLDLLEKMLTFAPEKRITVEQALAHPFLAAFHDEANEPVVSRPFEFEFEHANLNKEQLKALLWHEVLAFYPELAGSTPAVPLPVPPPVQAQQQQQQQAQHQQPVVPSSNSHAVDASIAAAVAHK